MLLLATEPIDSRTQWMSYLRNHLPMDGESSARKKWNMMRPLAVSINQGNWMSWTESGPQLENGVCSSVMFSNIVRVNWCHLSASVDYFWTFFGWFLMKSENVLGSRFIADCVQWTLFSIIHCLHYLIFYSFNLPNLKGSGKVRQKSWNWLIDGRIVYHEVCNSTHLTKYHWVYLNVVFNRTDLTKVRIWIMNQKIATYLFRSWKKLISS